MFTQYIKLTCDDCQKETESYEGKSVVKLCKDIGWQIVLITGLQPKHICPTCYKPHRKAAYTGKSFNNICGKCGHNWVDNGKPPCPICGTRFNVVRTKLLRSNLR